LGRSDGGGGRTRRKRERGLGVRKDYFQSGEKKEAKEQGKKATKKLAGDPPFWMMEKSQKRANLKWKSKEKGGFVLGVPGRRELGKSVERKKRVVPSVVGDDYQKGGQCAV